MARETAEVLCEGDIYDHIVRPATDDDLERYEIRS